MGVTTRPTARPPQSRNAPAGSNRPEHTSPLGFRIPPPPPLPGQDPSAHSGDLESINAPVFGPAPVPQADGPPPTLRPPPGSMRPLVRTVSTAPRSNPSARPGAVAYEDIARAGHEPWEAPPPRYNGAYEGNEGNAERATIVQAPAQSFTLVNQLLLAGLTAGFVVALGLLFLRTTTEKAPPPAAAPTQQAVAQQPAPPPQTAAPTAQQVTAAPVATHEAPAPPPAVASPATDRPKPDAMPDPSMLDNTTGYLMVKGPMNANVYLNGVKRGATGDPMLVPCGRFYMRLAPPTTDRFPEWITPGETIFVACRSTTVHTVDAAEVQGGVAPAPLPIRTQKGSFGL
jgi:hypothetical protein